MRILFADTCYVPLIEEHYGARPGLAARPYREQLESLLHYRRPAPFSG